MIRSCLNRPSPTGGTCTPPSPPGGTWRFKHDFEKNLKMIHGRCDVSQVKGCVSHQKKTTSARARVVHAAPSGVVIARCCCSFRVFHFARAQPVFVSGCLFGLRRPAERRPGAGRVSSVVVRWHFHPRGAQKKNKFFFFFSRSRKKYSSNIRRLDALDTRGGAT